MLLGGGFNPFEKYWSNWIISPGRDENKKYLKPPPRLIHWGCKLDLLRYVVYLCGASASASHS